MTEQSSQIGSPLHQRYLLDANIFRNLACGDLQAFEKPLLARSASLSGEQTLWTSDIAVQEIVQHIHDDQSKDFEMYQKALVWMERLCGPSGSAGDTGHATRKAIFSDYRSTPDTAIPDQLRRRIIEAGNFDSLSSHDRICLEQLRRNLKNDRENWANRLQKVYESLRAKGALAGANFDCGAAAKDIFDVFWEDISKQTYDEQGRRTTLRPKGEVFDRLREYSYFAAALHRKASGKHGYNFLNHATDHLDQLFCLFAAQDFQLVTADRRLIDTIQQVRCPSPRVISLEAAFPPESERKLTKAGRIPNE